MIRVNVPLGVVLAEIEKCAARKPLNEFICHIRSRRLGRATYIIELRCEPSKPNCPRAEVTIQGDSREGGTMVQVTPGSADAGDREFAANVEEALWNYFRRYLTRHPPSG